MKMRLKKAQIAIFVIIAILVVLMIILLVFLLPKKQVSGDVEINNAIIQVQDCLDDSLANALVYVASTGGYYSTEPQISSNYLDRKIAVYVANNFVYVPTKTLIEKEIGSYINDDLRACIAILDLSGVDEINVNNVNTKVTISKDRAVAKSYVDIELIKGETSFKLNNLDSIEKTELLSLYNLAVDLATQQKQESGGLCISCFADLEEKTNINILIYDFAPEQNILLYTLQSKTLGANPDLIFQFFAERVTYGTYP